MAEGAQLVIPVAFEFSGGESVLRVDLLIAAAGQVRAEAGLRDLLVMVSLETLMVALALREHLVQGLELGGRNGVEKGLDHEGLDRRPFEMDTAGLGEAARHRRTRIAGARTIGHRHPVAAPPTGEEPLE